MQGGAVLQAAKRILPHLKPARTQPNGIICMFEAKRSEIFLTAWGLLGGLSMGREEGHPSRLPPA
jgi:hypothetical protein